MQTKTSFTSGVSAQFTSEAIAADVAPLTAASRSRQFRPRAFHEAPRSAGHASSGSTP
jgi:hypothetical protein